MRTYMCVSSRTHSLEQRERGEEDEREEEGRERKERRGREGERDGRREGRSDGEGETRNTDRKESPHCMSSFLPAFATSVIHKLRHLESV